VAAVNSHVGEKGLELVADPRKVGRDRPRFDVMAHENYIEAEGVRGGFDVQVVHTAET
jgi:hypothetical protein